MYIYINISDNQPTIYETEEKALKKNGFGEFVYRLNLSTLEIERIDHKK